MLAIPATEFMLTIGKQLMERGLAETTVAAYLKTLYMLNNKKPFTSLAFLRKKDAIAEKMEGYAENTRKSILGAICSVLSLNKEKGPGKKAYEYYSNLLKETKTGGEKPEIGEKTDKEKESWVSWEDVEKKRTELGESAAKVKAKATPDQYTGLLNYAVLSLYTLVPPRRNQDFLNMKVVSKWSEEMPADTNYLDFAGSAKPSRFVFNKYKTAKKHGTQTFDIPDELSSVLIQYLKHNPLRPAGRSKTFSYPFLVNANGEPLTAVNAITRILNKIFGKKIGSSLLRHIYLSSKYDVDEMKDDALKMGHTVSTQRDYLRGEDEADDKIVHEKD